VNTTFPIGLKAEEDEFKARDFDGNVQFIKEKSSTPTM
jgi:hypothetical protein